MDGSIFLSYIHQMVKLLVALQNCKYLFIGAQRWIKRLIGPLLPDITYMDFKEPKVRLYLSLKDMKGPSFHLLHKGQKGLDYELELRKEIINYLPDDGVFFDVGTNIGLITFTTALAKPNAQIYSFEPEPLSYAILHKTKLANNFPNVHLIPIALAEKTYLATFHVDVANHGGHSLDKSQIADSQLSVPVTSLVDTLDRMTRILNVTKMDVIKIDVQGFEEQVLQGGLSVLKELNPVVVVEWTFKTGHDNDLVNYFSVLQGDYKFKIPGGKLRSLAELPLALKNKKAEGALYGDYIFVPANKV